MKRIRGGSGLGDSVYLRPVVDYFIRAGEPATVMSNFPDVFIGSGAKVEQFNRININVLAHYSLDRQNQNSTQFADMLRCAKLPPDVPLRFEWSVRNKALVDGVRAAAAGRPVIIVHGGRTPFGRTDGLGAEILPERAAFDVAVRALRECFTVRVGKGPSLYDIPARSDLTDRTSVSDLLDLIMNCDGVVTQCGYPVPMAECLGKPLLAVWSARGLQSPNPTIASITPAKILSAKTSRFVMDDWPEEQIVDVARSAILQDTYA